MMENPILGMAIPMDSVCHIYKQMRTPYCFDIKIGIERTDARRRRIEKRGDGVPREQVSHPMMDEKFCIQLGNKAATPFFP